MATLTSIGSCFCSSDYLLCWLKEYNQKLCSIKWLLKCDPTFCDVLDIHWDHKMIRSRILDMLDVTGIRVQIGSKFLSMIWKKISVSDISGFIPCDSVLDSMFCLTFYIQRVIIQTSNNCKVDVFMPLKFLFCFKIIMLLDNFLCRSVLCLIFSFL